MGDGEYCDLHDREKSQRRLVVVVLGSVLFLIGFLILLIWLILRPTKPHFILQDAAVYAFNFSSSGNLLTTNLQITLSFRNPNHRIGIYYEKLQAYAAYRDEQITVPAVLQPVYIRKQHVAVWSMLLAGQNMALEPYNGFSLTKDQIAGTVMVNVKADGRIRWKVGHFLSGLYPIHVNCPAYIDFDGRSGKAAAIRPEPVKYQLFMDCRVRL